MSRQQSVKLAILFGILLIDVFGIGLMLPVIPGLVKELTGGDIASAAATYGGLIALYSLMQFIFGPTMGALSDRFGRRPILLVSMLGLGLDYLLLAVAPALWVVVVARIVGGAMGASISTASAYIADITPPEKRAQSFGIIGVAFGIGFITGPLVGGILGEYGARVPFYGASAVSFAALLLAWFLLPESLSRELRRPFRLREANPFGAILRIARYPTVPILMVVFVLSQLAERLLESTWVLFTSYQFGWTAVQVGVSFTWVGVLFVIAQGGLVRLVVPRLGEWQTVILGFAVAAVCMTSMAFVTNAWVLYVITVPYVLGWGLTGPAAQAVVTRIVPANEQGLLQGAMAAIATATGVIAPPVGGSLFGYFIGDRSPVHLPGVAFLVGGTMFVIGLIVASRPHLIAAVRAAMVTPEPAKA
jgi:DHA1 family tetracycline resistance protein-like MFS transporter